MLELLKNYLLLNLDDYISGLHFPINIFILSLAVGICIAMFVMTFHRRYVSVMIKQLVRHGATGEENAKTLAELKITPTPSIKSALSRSGQLTDMVKRAGEIAYTYEEYVKLQKKKGFKDEKIDFETAKFYISEEKMPRALKINDDGFPSYIHTALASVLVLIIFTSIAVFMPEILSLLT